MESDILTLSEPSMCLICNKHPRAGNDDLCDPCSRQSLSWQSNTPLSLQTPPPYVAPRKIDAYEGNDNDDSDILEIEIKRILRKRK